MHAAKAVRHRWTSFGICGNRSWLSRHGTDRSRSKTTVPSVTVARPLFVSLNSSDAIESERLSRSIRPLTVSRISMRDSSSSGCHAQTCILIIRATTMPITDKDDDDDDDGEEKKQRSLARSPEDFRTHASQYLCVHLQHATQSCSYLHD